ncbi:hypothetical protein PHYPSEUDO_012231 [Phytophthora pseudosyringae]|uniref:Uncharacterized protein n=1 Tax=Phytophthora pseudosyringae TaxID=221518 RepID=A0A8T1V9T0_9STRA|nr:hypothetical protein PHYPSEUDO_012231 [Phytophthora pseudosyringae]
MDVELLFHHFSQPKYWLLYRHGHAPKSKQWPTDLITKKQITALHRGPPWNVLQTPVTPTSFRADGWFQSLTTKYRKIAEEHRQTVWESTHAFPIRSKDRKNSPFLATFWLARKQRRSRLGARWEKFLQERIS